MNTSASRSRSMNVTFTAHYSYKSKYSFDVTTRSDGNTRFGDAKRWGTFPAVSGRWNVSDEPWFDNLRNAGVLDMMAARISWGITGNAPGGDGLFYSKYSTGNSYLSTTTIHPNNIRMSSMHFTPVPASQEGNTALMQHNMSVMLVPDDATMTKWWLTGAGSSLRERYGRAKYRNRIPATPEEVAEDMDSVDIKVIVKQSSLWLRIPGYWRWESAASTP